MEPLGRYRSRRDFTRTPEPAGPVADTTADTLPGTTADTIADIGDTPGATPAPTTGGRFVVQRHRARRLHYDLRFEIDGVLVSWAVPRGPTLDPARRNLAVHVEDHPLEYLDFEGVIPAGEYGGGDVIVWDRGTWELRGADDAAAAVAAGKLHAEMHGEKLRGGLVLVRTGSRAARGAGDGEPRARGGAEWLLLHTRDAHAVDGWDPEDHPRSVRSGRTNDEVAADPERRWTDRGAEVLRAPDVHVPAPSDDELAALDALDGQGRWWFQGRELRLTNLDKVLFPARPGEAPVTKRDLVRYAALIAPVAVPHLAGRPVNLHRFPDGADRPGFWQQAAPGHVPAWFTTWEGAVGGSGAHQRRFVVDSAPALAWLANHGALEWHAWTSLAAAPHRPTYALVDLDPGPATSWDDLVVLARLHRVALDHVGLVGFPKVTGRRGIQVWIPIAPGPGHDEVRAWVEVLSRAVGAIVPDLVSWSWEVKDRGGRARLDYTQNAAHKTLIAPYSPRPAPGAPVSVPITWDELDDPGLRPDRWTIRSVVDRVATLGDPFAAMRGHAQVLPPWG
jgi:bifunctional non-homologous end joining protein LigD